MIIHEEAGFVLWAEEIKEKFYIHCDIQWGGKRHWQNRKKYLKMLPKNSFVLQEKDDKRLYNFLERIGAKHLCRKIHNGELTSIWRLK